MVDTVTHAFFDILSEIFYKIFYKNFSVQEKNSKFGISIFAKIVLKQGFIHDFLTS